MKLHLVDATFELFRAFYSRPPRRAPDGRPVNAVQGLIDSMLSLLREDDLTHIGAATDYVIESWRNDLFPGYKSSAGLDPTLLAQFRDAEEALRSLGIPVWPMVEDEADDGLASAVARFGGDRRLEQVVICSVDKDLAQLVDGDRIVLRDRMRKIEYDEAGVIEKFGVRPESIPDYLALVGDSAWYALGRMGGAAIRGRDAYRRVGPLVERLARRVGPWEIVLTRFVFGTRTASMVFWGMRGLPWLRFAAFDLLGATLGAVCLVTLGFLASQSAERLLGRVKQVERWLLVAVVATAAAVVVVHLVGRFSRAGATGRPDRSEPGR